jgi:hypothetical protein
MSRGHRRHERLFDPRDGRNDDSPTERGGMAVLGEASFGPSAAVLDRAIRGKILCGDLT